MVDFDPIAFARSNISYHTDVNWPAGLNKVNYVLRGNGLWEVRKNKIGTFYVHLHDMVVGGFPEESRKSSFVDLNVPKIPAQIFEQILSFFKKLTESHNFEAYVQIYWNSEKQEYFVLCPPQIVSHGRVKYEPSKVDANHVLVCEIHSHNSMAAFFSNVDDADEKKRGDRFFGVVGKLNTSSPEFKLSFILGGGQRNLVPSNVLFEDSESKFPEEWLSSVTYADKVMGKHVAKSFDDFDDDDDDDDDEEFSDKPPKNKGKHNYPGALGAIDMSEYQRQRQFDAFVGRRDGRSRSFDLEEDVEDN